jgi:hypothetical protein
LNFGGGAGGVLVEKLLDVALVGFGVLVGQDSGLGSETMAQRVEGRTLLAGLGARTGGVEGVGAVGGGAVGFCWAGAKRSAARGGCWAGLWCAPHPLRFWVGRPRRRRGRADFCGVGLRARASAG